MGDGELNICFSQDDETLSNPATESLTLKEKSSDDEDTRDMTGSDEEYDDDADVRAGGVGSIWATKPCAICVYLFLTLLLVASIVALIVVGILIWQPYNMAAGFKDSTCTVKEVAFNKDEHSCSCGKNCNSRYPCLRITVSFTDFGGHFKTATLFENEATLKRECSFHPPCKSPKKSNKLAVDKYRQDYGMSGDNYTCLYNPEDTSQVIRHRHFQRHHVVHGFFWSSVIIILSFSLLTFTIKKKGCNTL